MRLLLSLLVPIGLVLPFLPARAAEPVAKPAAEKLRIIVFGAHPDDAELKAGGTAGKWAKLGHEV